MVELLPKSSDYSSRCVLPDWHNCTAGDLENYTIYLTNLLLQQQRHFRNICGQRDCRSIEHQEDIDRYLNQIYNCVREATDCCIPSKINKPSEFCIAGWNDLVAEKHVIARTSFLEWMALGKPREGFEYNMMRRTRAQLKLAVRFCKRNEEQLRCDALAKDHLKNNDDFWKKVKILHNGRMTKHATVIGDAKDDASIVRLWKQSFQQLYSQRSNEGLLVDTILHASNSAYTISVVDVNKAIQNLKCRKSYGPDGVAPEAIKYGGSVLAVHLTLLFNMFISHCYIPVDLIQTTIVPLLKNKAGDISDMSNYRAIALSNSISKVLENVLLTCFQACDDYDDYHQFGFRRNHSTTLACSVLKNTVDYYRRHGSYVFVCLLDLSKAFDSVDHKLLFQKLYSLNVPGNILKLLAFWYLNQTINVRWKHILSECFYMTNGTRQGSILSPYLFSVYIRDVSEAVSKSLVGCRIGNRPCNVLLYADDIVILSPTWHAQQSLLDLCNSIISSLAMTFNTSKSVTVIFTPYKAKWRVDYTFPAFELQGCKLSVVDKCKYLGHYISAEDDDNVDIMHQKGLLYARTNFLLRKFAKCSTEVKICLFKAFCINFYGMSLWNRYNATVFQALESAYVKCIKMFFQYDKRHSVTAIFMELGLPTLTTLLFNAKFRQSATSRSHDNVLVSYVHGICAMQNY